MDQLKWTTSDYILSTNECYKGIKASKFIRSVIDFSHNKRVVTVFYVIDSTKISNNLSMGVGVSKNVLQKFKINWICSFSWVAIKTNLVTFLGTLGERFFFLLKNVELWIYVYWILFIA